MDLIPVPSSVTAPFAQSDVTGLVDALAAKQPHDVDLDTWATKTAPSGTVVGTTDSQIITNKTLALASNTVNFTASGAGAVARTTQSKLNDVVSVKDFGALGDGKNVIDGTISVGVATVTSPTASFAAGDVGKTIVINAAGAAGVNLVTTIAGYTNSTTITVTATPSTAVNAGEAVISWGTNDTAAINAAIASLPAVSGSLDFPRGGGEVYFPSGRYMVVSTLTVRSLVQLTGAGSHKTILDAQGMTTGNIFTFSSLIDSMAQSVTMIGFSAQGPGRASSVNGIVTPMCHCNFEDLHFRTFKDAISVGAAGSWNTFQNVRASDNQRGVVLGTNSTTNHFISCYIDQNEQGVVSSGSQTNAFHGCVFESNDRATSLTDGNVGVLLQGDQWSIFCGCHFENNPVDVKLDTNGSRASESVLFDGCMFNPPNSVASHFQIVSAYYTKINNCSLSAGTAQYIRIWDAGIGTQIDNRSANQTWGYRNEANSIVTTPPGVWTTEVVRGGSAAIGLLGTLAVTGAGTFTTFVAIGTTPADSGIIRIPLNTYISAGRSAGDGSALEMIGNVTGDILEIGAGGFSKIGLNPSQRDMDVFVLSDTGTLLYCDAGLIAGAGAVGIGAAPSGTYTLEVTGSLGVSTSITCATIAMGLTNNAKKALLWNDVSEGIYAGIGRVGGAGGTMDFFSDRVGGSAMRFGWMDGDGVFTEKVKITGATGVMTFVDAANFVFGTTTGTKFGTATGEKLSLWNKTPIIQPTALTAADASTVDSTYGAEESAVIANLRTRLNELETRLTSFGFLP